MFACNLSLPEGRCSPLGSSPGGLEAAALVLGIRHATGEAGGTITRAAVAGVLVLIMLLAVRYVRARLVRRQLKARETYDLLPSTSFDPAPEDVARFAHQLARTRPAVAWLRPRRGASVRIRLYTDTEGRLCYQISGPASAGSVLRHQTYPQVELREAESPSRGGTGQGHIAGEEE